MGREKRCLTDKGIRNRLIAVIKKNRNEESVEPSE